MENGYIYIRVSTLIQVDGFSLDAQEEEIRAFAKMHDINIVGRYSEMCPPTMIQMHPPCTSDAP